MLHRRAGTVTPDRLAKIATLLLGHRWQRPLSRELGVDDRLVRRWASGERPIPAWVETRLLEMVEQRAEEIRRVLRSA